MNRIRAAALLALTGLAFVSGCMSNPCNNSCNGGGFFQRLGFGSRRQCCPETCCPSCATAGCCEGIGEGPVLGDPNGPYIMPGPVPGAVPGMQDLGQPRILPQPAQPTPAPPEMTSRVKPK